MKYLPLALFSCCTLTSLFSAESSVADSQKEELKGKTLLSMAAANEKAGMPNQSADAKPKERSVLDGMTILGIQGNWTAVPSNAFLYKPESSSRYVLEKPVGKYLPWGDFARINRGWIDAFPVSIEMIKGLAPIGPAEVKRFKIADRVVVATYNNSPVSVLSSKNPKENESK